MRIIVVDDEINALLSFLGDIIEFKDIEYKFFKDDENEITDYITQNHIDAAFLDVNMPNINGLQLAERLIALNPSLKIVFITGLNITEKNLADTVRAHTVGFLYKPYDVNVLERYILAIKNTTPRLTATMFGSFDCYINGKLIAFSSAKSKELFALLLVYNGKTLTMSDAITHLWADTHIEKSKILYRDAVWRLRRTLNEISFPCVNFQRGALTLNPDSITCDYWQYLQNGECEYSGEFLKSYDWSMEYLSILPPPPQQPPIIKDTDDE